MSADLLDLDSFYSSPPPPQQQRSRGATAASTDFFDFTNFTSNNGGSKLAAAPPAPAQQTQTQTQTQTQPWPDFQTQQPSGASAASSSNNNGGWGDFGSFSSGFMSSTPTIHQPQPQKPIQQNVEEDDDFGDFEVAEPTPTQRSFVLPPQTNKARASPPPRTRLARASTLDLMSNNLIDVIDMPMGSNLAPILSPGLPSPGLSAQQPNRQPSPGTWRSGPLKPPASPNLSAQRGTSPKPQPSPRLRGQMPVISRNPSPARNPSPKPTKKADSNILFDAEEFELQGGNDDDDDDDEFGDFETVQTPFPGSNMSPTLDSAPKQKQQKQPQQTSQPASMDLLSLDDPLPISQPQPTRPQLSSLNLNAPASPYPQAPKSPSFQERNPFPGLGLTTPTNADFKKEEDKQKSPSPITAWPAFGQTSSDKPSAAVKKSTSIAKQPTVEEDLWGDFEDFDDEPSAIDSSKPPESWDWDAIDNVKPTPKPAPKPAAAPAPTATQTMTNLLGDPEPAPELLETANTALFKPLNGQMPPVKKKILSDPKTVTFLKGYLTLASVAARVIAGRKQRWHRDKFLSQGMAISAAGAKGMKLAGVDKAQAAREDREAADVIGVWKENVGRLRSAVVTANSALKNEQLRVPELSETMPVSTAKVVPTAPKACIICGLKRDERVSKVDVDVEDSFGEWWVEHWGHRACKNFWNRVTQQLGPGSQEVVPQVY
uniref:Serine threonine-protein kinase ppk6 n=1 Tax=Colletotrichum fructicola (strain Nara gc5) TaxID=1213859 RepID=L2G4S8_COLFN